MPSLIRGMMNGASKDRLQRELNYYRSRTAYVTDSRRLKRMQEHLHQAQQHLEKDELTEAFDSYYLAKREYLVARKRRQVFFYRSPFGMALATALAFAFTIVILGVWLGQDALDSGIAPLLAALGGGIGGCAAVLIQAIDVEPESETVSKPPWYVIKPILGGALGLITYFAVVSGLNVIAEGAQVTSFEAAVVIGFLAGFFESFSTGVLARAAGRFVESQPSEPQADVVEEQEEDNDKGQSKDDDTKQRDGES